MLSGAERSSAFRVSLTTVFGRGQGLRGDQVNQLRERGAMRHPNVRNADEVDAREMIKGRHNMRLRQLGKPAGSSALGATLTEVAPGGVSFPATPIMSTKRRYMSSPVPERRGSATRASPCGRGTGLRCRPDSRTHTKWSTSQRQNRSSISASRQCSGRRSSSIQIRARSALVSPIRQAQSASAASASSAPEAARSTTGTANPKRAEPGPTEPPDQRRRVFLR